MARVNSKTKFKVGDTLLPIKGRRSSNGWKLTPGHLYHVTSIYDRYDGKVCIYIRYDMDGYNATLYERVAKGEVVQVFDDAFTVASKESLVESYEIF